MDFFLVRPWLIHVDVRFGKEQTFFLLKHGDQDTFSFVNGVVVDFPQQGESRRIYCTCFPVLQFPKSNQRRDFQEPCIWT